MTSPTPHGPAEDKRAPIVDLAARHGPDLDRASILNPPPV